MSDTPSGCGFLLVIILIVAVVSCSENAEKVKKLEREVQELKAAAAHKPAWMPGLTKPPAEAPIK